MSVKDTKQYGDQNVLPLSVSPDSLPSPPAVSAAEIRGSFTEDKRRSNNVRWKYRGTTNTKGNLDTVTDSENNQRVSKPSLCSRISDCKDFYSKVLASISFCGAFFMLGWSKGQIGPSFLDLQFITNTDVERASGFQTAYYVGRMLGSVVTGAVFHRVNLKILFLLAILCNGAIAAVLPWCAIYELMVGAHVIYGISGGVIDAGVTSVSVAIWNIRGSRTYIQIINLVYSIASILSPVVTAPFLLDRDQCESSEINTCFNVSRNVENATTKLMSTIKYDVEEPESRLYIAYIVTAALSFSVCIPFLIMLLCNSKSTTRSKSTRERKLFNFHGKLPRSKNIISLINVGVFICLINAMDYSFPGFLTLFCVRHLQWSKFNSSFLTSAFFLANLVGQFFNVLLILMCSSVKILCFSVIMSTFGYAGFLVSAHFHNDEGVWLSTCVTGLFSSMGYSVFLAWTNDTLISISGPISSYILVSAFIGALLNPLIISFLMEKYSNMWFCYGSLIGSCTLFLPLFVTLWYTSLMKKHNRK